MEPENQIIQLLQELRDEVRRSSDRCEAGIEQMERRLERIDERSNDKKDEHFEVLKDLSEQLSMLTDEIRTSLDALEKANGH